MKEEFKEFLESEEGQQFLDNALSEKVKENGYKSQEEVQGLVNKNKELLGKIKKAKGTKDLSISEDSKELLNVLDEHDILSKDDLDEFLEKSNKSEKGSSDLNRQYKRLLKEHEKLSNQLNQEMERANMERQARVGSEQKAILTASLQKAKVKENAFDFAYDHFEKRTIAEFDDDGNVSFIAKDADGLSPKIEKYIEEWAQTDVAKEFIQQPVNQGAGNPLGKNSKGATMTRSEFDQKNPNEKAEIMKNGSVKLVD